MRSYYARSGVQRSCSSTVDDYRQTAEMRGPVSSQRKPVELAEMRCVEVANVVCRDEMSHAGPVTISGCIGIEEATRTYEDLRRCRGQAALHWVPGGRPRIALTLRWNRKKEKQERKQRFLVDGPGSRELPDGTGKRKNRSENKVQNVDCVSVLYVFV
ncbi:hypothetical protein NDU88_003569 [Pleurodeles waltl]|uniref:Uncharacterized protein n=1 Tax=Pleurodeles waltl TaxID=8319 RepID=A0AAV7KYW3_PLEWA|nr:hypothetical protein NDU88_003569 [Pleurodeles waltl]